MQSSPRKKSNLHVQRTFVDKILEEKVSKDIAVYDTSVGQRN